MSLDSLLSKTLTNKYRVNTSDFCDRKHHISFMSYHKYRRGKTRCQTCGAKIGPIKLDAPKSMVQRMKENIFSESPLMKLLGGK